MASHSSHTSLSALITHEDNLDPDVIANCRAVLSFRYQKFDMHSTRFPTDGHLS